VKIRGRDYTQIRPVWIGELETRLKTSKLIIESSYFYFYLQIFFVMSATA
jgi:hypothetical protein